MIVVPFLGVLIYLIAHGQDMGKRDIEQAQAQKAQFDQYVKSVAAEDGGAAQIAQAKSLLDSGTITQDEYDRLNAKALAS